MSQHAQLPSDPPTAPRAFQDQPVIELTGVSKLYQRHGANVQA